MAIIIEYNITLNLSFITFKYFFILTHKWLTKVEFPFLTISYVNKLYSFNQIVQTTLSKHSIVKSLPSPSIY